MGETYSYTVDKKSEGKYKLARFLRVLFYALFLIAFFDVCYVTKLIPVFAVAPLLVWMLVFFTWRFVSIKYKYTVESGMLKLIVIYGGKKEKVKIILHIKEIKAFLPKESSYDAVKNFNPNKIYNLLSSQRTADEAYVLLTEFDGKRVEALIEAPAVSRKAILYYATDTVRNGELS